MKHTRGLESIWEDIFVDVLDFRLELLNVVRLRLVVYRGWRHVDKYSLGIRKANEVHAQTDAEKGENPKSSRFKTPDGP